MSIFFPFFAVLIADLTPETRLPKGGRVFF